MDLEIDLKSKLTDAELNKLKDEELIETKEELEKIIQNLKEYIIEEETKENE